MLLFSGTVVATRFAVRELDATFIALGRALVAAVLAAGVLRARRAPLPSRAQWRRIALVSGGVVQWGGQAMRIDPGGACLRCLYGTAPREDEVPTCARAGVLGSLAGVLGALQASLALGPPTPEGRSTLHVVDGWSLRFRTLTVRQVPGCSGCGARA